MAKVKVTKKQQPPADYKSRMKSTREQLEILKEFGIDPQELMKYVLQNPRKYVDSLQELSKLDMSELAKLQETVVTIMQGQLQDFEEAEEEETEEEEPEEDVESVEEPEEDLAAD